MKMNHKCFHCFFFIFIKSTFQNRKRKEFEIFRFRIVQKNNRSETKTHEKKKSVQRFFSFVFVFYLTTGENKSKTVKIFILITHERGEFFLEIIFAKERKRFVFLRIYRQLIYIDQNFRFSFCDHEKVVRKRSFSYLNSLNHWLKKILLKDFPLTISNDLTSMLNFSH